LVVSTSAIDCLERLVYEMTYCVSRGTLNPTLWLTQSFLLSLSRQNLCSLFAGNKRDRSETLNTMCRMVSFHGRLLFSKL